MALLLGDSAGDLGDDRAVAVQVAGTAGQTGQGFQVGYQFYVATAARGVAEEQAQERVCAKLVDAARITCPFRRVGHGGEPVGGGQGRVGREVEARQGGAAVFAGLEHHATFGHAGAVAAGGRLRIGFDD